MCKKVGMLVLIVLLVWAGNPSIGAVGNEQVYTNEKEMDTLQEEKKAEQEGRSVDGGLESVFTGKEKSNSIWQQKSESTQVKSFGVQASNESGFVYVDNGDGAVMITDYTGSETNLEIPETIAGLSVTNIGTQAFWNKGLTSVVIPEGVISIGQRAFSRNVLTSVIIPESVERIEGQAFEENNLTRVVVPEGVESIGMSAFDGNPLSSIFVLNSETIIDLMAFGIGEELTIFGERGSTAEGYAQWAEVTFKIIDDPFAAIVFTPNGGTSEVDEVGVRITVYSNIDTLTLQYQWSSSTEPPTNEAWTEFENKDKITSAGLGGESYLHVRVLNVAQEVIVSDRTEAFLLEEKPFDIGDGTKDHPYIIETANQLDTVRNNLDAHYQLGAHIDLGAYSDGEGWEPIGYFTGSLDGADFTISGLTINRPDQNSQALFARTGPTSAIKNITLENVNVSGEQYVAALVGINSGTIENVTISEGAIKGDSYVGGLTGQNHAAVDDVKIVNASANIDIQGAETSDGLNTAEAVGGLIGENIIMGEGASVEISDSYATGAVSGYQHIGGLIGRNAFYENVASGNIEINRSYATGDVTGNSYIGGLVGHNIVTGSGSIEINRSYAAGKVVGSDVHIGGLVGRNFTGSLTNTYAIGDVEGNNNVGGLVGENVGTISNSYAIGAVTGDEMYVGGLVGGNSAGIVTGSVSDSYWNRSVNEALPIDNDTGTPKEESELKQRETYPNWSFADVWYQYEHQTYPFFQWQALFETWDVEIEKKSLTVGEETEIRVTAKHEGELEYNATATADYEVEPKGVITIENGIVTAEKGGKTTITVSLHDETKKIEINVIPAAPLIDDIPNIVNTDTVNITGTSQPGATIYIKGGSEEISGTVGTNGGFAIDVPLKQNTENPLQVTAVVDGLESDAVTVTIVHDDTPPSSGGGYIPSPDTTLKNLKILEEGINIIDFDPNQFEYTLETEATEVELVIKPSYSRAKVKVNDEIVEKNTPLPLAEGENIYEIMVIAENGKEQKYVVTIHRLEVVPFPDIEGHWAEEYIKKAYRNGWFKGYPDGSFGPENSVTRMQATSLFVRIHEFIKSVTVPFTDIHSIEDETLEELEKAYANGIVNGFPDQTFKPYQNVTRAQFALMIYRSYEKITGTFYEPKQQTNFPDIAGYDTETKNAISMLVELEIAEGSEGKFLPSNHATRAHAAKMLVNYHEVLTTLE